MRTSATLPAQASCRLAELLDGLRAVPGAAARRQAAFLLVREIPYGTLAAHDVTDALTGNRGDCHAKAQLLAMLLDGLGCRTRLSVMQYRLRDFPLEVRFIPGQLDYHYAVQVRLTGHWRDVDCAYDAPLAKLGFTVNDWDGRGSTALCETPLSRKVHGSAQVSFDRARRAFERQLDEAYRLHKPDIQAYQANFNAWLQSAR